MVFLSKSVSSACSIVTVRELAFELCDHRSLPSLAGSFATASCLRCRTKFPGSAIEADVFASRVPLCPLCTAVDEEKARNAPPPKKSPEKWSANSKAFEDHEDDEKGYVSEWEGKPLVKPDIVFFGWVLLLSRNGPRLNPCSPLQRDALGRVRPSSARGSREGGPVDRHWNFSPRKMDLSSLLAAPAHTSL